ncbi:hypothetical protein M8J75_010712, partial [Diaphorina citri]
QLLSRVECKQHLIIHWNLHHYYGGDIYKMLRHGSPSASNGQESQSDLSPSESPRVLKLTEDIKKLLRRASIVQGCNTSLQVLHSTSSYTQAYTAVTTLQSTSSYTQAYTAVTTLQRYLDLQHIEDPVQLTKLPFSSILTRYLEPLPSSLQDQQLLLLLLNKQNLLSLITSSPRNLTHHTLLFIQLLKLVTKIIATHPDRVQDYESLTQSVLVCIEHHEQMDSSMVNICLEYLSLILYHSPNTKSLDTQCLWSLLVADSNTRARTDLVLQCLNLILSNILTDSVALGVFLSEINYPALRSCLSSRGSININTRGSINNTSTGDSINANTRGTIYNTRGSVTYSMGSVKACAYHLICGLCSNRGSVTALLHNIPHLVDDALRDVVAVRNADLVAQCAAMCCANMASFSTSEILLRKCIDENFFTKVIPILSNPRSSSLKSAVCLLVNNLFNLNPGLLAQTDPMVQLICVLMSEMTKYCSTPLTTELTELCSSMSRILTLYFGLNPEVPLISDKFTSALIYILNASSY